MDTPLSCMVCGHAARVRARHGAFEAPFCSAACSALFCECVMSDDSSASLFSALIGPRYGEKRAAGDAPDDEARAAKAARADLEPMIAQATAVLGTRWQDLPVDVRIALLGTKLSLRQFMRVLRADPSLWRAFNDTRRRAYYTWLLKRLRVAPTLRNTPWVEARCTLRSFDYLVLSPDGRSVVEVVPMRSRERAVPYGPVVLAVEIADDGTRRATLHDPLGIVKNLLRAGLKPARHQVTGEAILTWKRIAELLRFKDPETESEDDGNDPNETFYKLRSADELHLDDANRRPPPRLELERTPNDAHVVLFSAASIYAHERPGAMRSEHARFRALIGWNDILEEDLYIEKYEFTQVVNGAVKRSFPLRASDREECYLGADNAPLVGTLELQLSVDASDGVRFGWEYSGDRSLPLRLPRNLAMVGGAYLLTTPFELQLTRCANKEELERHVRTTTPKRVATASSGQFDMPFPVSRNEMHERLKRVPAGVTACLYTLRVVVEDAVLLTRNGQADGTHDVVLLVHRPICELDKCWSEPDKTIHHAPLEETFTSGAPEPVDGPPIVEYEGAVVSVRTAFSFVVTSPTDIERIYAGLRLAEQPAFRGLPRPAALRVRSRRGDQFSFANLLFPSAGPRCVVTDATIKGATDNQLVVVRQGEPPLTAHE